MRKLFKHFIFYSALVFISIRPSYANENNIAGKESQLLTPEGTFKVLANTLQPLVITLSRPVYAYHYRGRFDEESDYIHPQDEDWIAAINKEMHDTLWDKTITIDDLANGSWFGAGVYLAADPAMSRDFGGYMDSWLLIQVQFPQGTQLLDMSETADQIPLTASLRAALLKHYKCPIRKLKDIFEVTKNYKPACFDVRRSLIETMKLTAFLYSWSESKLPKSICANNTKGIAFFLTSSSPLKNENVRFFTKGLPAVDQPDNHGDLRAFINETIRISSTNKADLLWDSLPPFTDQEKLHQFIRDTSFSCSSTYSEDFNGKTSAALFQRLSDEVAPWENFKEKVSKEALKSDISWSMNKPLSSIDEARSACFLQATGLVEKAFSQLSQIDLIAMGYEGWETPADIDTFVKSCIDLAAAREKEKQVLQEKSGSLLVSNLLADPQWSWASLKTSSCYSTQYWEDCNKAAQAEGQKIITQNMSSLTSQKFEFYNPSSDYLTVFGTQHACGVMARTCWEEASKLDKITEELKKDFINNFTLSDELYQKVRSNNYYEFGNICSKTYSEYLLNLFKQKIPNNSSKGLINAEEYLFSREYSLPKQVCYSVFQELTDKIYNKYTDKINEYTKALIDDPQWSRESLSKNSCFTHQYFDDCVTRGYQMNNYVSDDADPQFKAFGMNSERIFRTLIGRACNNINNRCYEENKLYESLKENITNTVRDTFPFSGNLISPIMKDQYEDFSNSCKAMEASIKEIFDKINSESTASYKLFNPEAQLFSKSGSFMERLCYNLWTQWTAKIKKTFENSSEKIVKYLLADPQWSLAALKGQDGCYDRSYRESCMSASNKYATEFESAINASRKEEKRLAEFSNSYLYGLLSSTACTKIEEYCQSDRSKIQSRDEAVIKKVTDKFEITDATYSEVLEKKYEFMQNYKKYIKSAFSQEQKEVKNVKLDSYYGLVSDKGLDIESYSSYSCYGIRDKIEKELAEKLNSFYTDSDIYLKNTLQKKRIKNLSEINSKSTWSLLIKWIEKQKKSTSVSEQNLWVRIKNSSLASGIISYLADLILKETTGFKDRLKVLHEKFTKRAVETPLLPSELPVNYEHQYYYNIMKKCNVAAAKILKSTIQEGSLPLPETFYKSQDELLFDYASEYCINRVSILKEEASAKIFPEVESMFIAFLSKEIAQCSRALIDICVRSDDVWNKTRSKIMDKYYNGQIKYNYELFAQALYKVSENHEKYILAAKEVIPLEKSSRKKLPRKR